MKLRLRITARAAAQIERAHVWWQENRPAAPDAVRSDLRATFELLLVQPGIGTKVTGARVAGVRRMQLDRIRYHLYYRIQGEELVVLVLWHSNRGREPQV